MARKTETEAEKMARYQRLANESLRDLRAIFNEVAVGKPLVPKRSRTSKAGPVIPQRPPTAARRGRGEQS